MSEFLRKMRNGASRPSLSTNLSAQLRRYVVPLALVMVLVGLSVSISTAGDEENLENVAIYKSPRELLGRPVNYAVIAYSPEMSSKFVASLKAIDQSADTVFVGDFNDLQQVDAIVYLIDKWGDAPKLPIVELFSGLAQRLESNTVEQTFKVHSATITGDTKSRDFFLFFLPAGYHLDRWDWQECYANITLQHVLHKWSDIYRTDNGNEVIGLNLVSTLWSKPSDFQSDQLQRERIVL